MKKEKKIKVDHKVKCGMIIGLIILIGVLGVEYILELQKVNTVEEEKTLYEYTYNTSMKYAVNLLDNILYEEDKLGEDQTYLSEFIRSINNHFTVSFKGSETATISGHYKIEAQVAGYTTAQQEEQEIKQDIWNKTFELVPEQTFTGEGEDYELQKTVEVNYKNYDDFGQSIVEATKVNAPIELRIKVSGQMDIETPYGVIAKPIQLLTTMPLNTSYFTITVEGEESVEDTIQETVTLTLPPEQTTKILYLVGIGLTVFIALFVIFFTGTLTVEDRRIKEIKHLLISYSSRMVGVKTIDDKGYDKYYEVKSLEDLVKIADELEQPLLYENNRDMLAIQKFYVMHNRNVYSYQLDKIIRKKTTPTEKEEIPQIETANWEHLEI